MTGRGMSVTDVLTDIDALIGEQLDAGEPENGYDYGDPDFPKCRWPGCWEDWHGLAITRRMRQMRARGWDPDYRYATDTSEVVCPGGDFVGPPRPERLQATGPVRRVTTAPDTTELNDVAQRLNDAFGGISAVWEQFRQAFVTSMAQSLDDLAARLFINGPARPRTIFTLGPRWELPPDPMMNPLRRFPTPAEPDPVIDRAMHANPPSRSLLDPDTEYNDGVVWVDHGSGFEWVQPHKHPIAPFALSVSARPNLNRNNSWQRSRQPTVTMHRPDGTIRARWPMSSWWWEVSVGAPSALHVIIPTPPPRRETTLIPTYRCERPSRIDQPRPWVQERGFDRRGQRKRARQ